MHTLRYLLLSGLFYACLMGCQPTSADQADHATTFPDAATEKAAILATLNAETQAFFNRDYETWQAQWVHAPFIAKSYMILTDSTMSETLGWEAIDQFGKTYLSEHPEPEPAPEPLTDISMRLYTTGAWVSFEQDDPQRGHKRETRLMEKADGQWKIAGMHTTVYGF
ncbi:MAG: nuclear transport factor 2 family protein [Bacteroidota bacterium]